MQPRRNYQVKTLYRRCQASSCQDGCIGHDKLGIGMPLDYLYTYSEAVDLFLDWMRDANTGQAILLLDDREIEHWIIDDPHRGGPRYRLMAQEVAEDVASMIWQLDGTIQMFDGGEHFLIDLPEGTAHTRTEFILPNRRHVCLGSDGGFTFSSRAVR